LIWSNVFSAPNPSRFLHNPRGFLDATVSLPPAFIALFLTTSALTLPIWRWSKKSTSASTCLRSPIPLFADNVVKSLDK